jgi:hypothetical protein
MSINSNLSKSIYVPQWKHFKIKSGFIFKIYSYIAFFSKFYFLRKSFMGYLSYPTAMHIYLVVLYQCKTPISLNMLIFTPTGFLAHLTQRVRWAIVTTEHLSSVVRPLTFHILINSSEATGPIWTKLWWNGPWMVPFQNCVRWSQLPTKMVAKLKIEKRGDEILIVHCCFSTSQNELKF